MKQKRTAYTYKLLNYYFEKGGVIEHIRLWLKQAATAYKYRFYPLVLTYSNKAGLYIEKKFKSFEALMTYLKAGWCSGNTSGS